MDPTRPDLVTDVSANPLTRVLLSPSPEKVQYDVSDEFCDDRACCPHESLLPRSLSPRLKVNPALVRRDAHCFDCSPHCPLDPNPIRVGKLYQLGPAGNVFPVDTILHVNGISWKEERGSRQGMMFSPFSLMRVCKVVLPENSDENQADLRKKLKMFKITHCSAQKTIYFGVKDTNPMDDGRADWIVDIVQEMVFLKHFCNLFLQNGKIMMKDNKIILFSMFFSLF